MQGRDPALDGEEVLGVVRPQCAGEHQRVGLTKVRGIVANVDGSAKLAQRLGVVVLRTVGTGNRIPGVEEQASDPAHTGASDSNEVERTELRGKGLREIRLDHWTRF